MIFAVVKFGQGAWLVVLLFPLGWLVLMTLNQRYRTEARPQGDPDLVKQALRLLQDADRPIVFAGAGVRWSNAHDALAALARALKVPVFLNSLGRGCLPPDDPHCFSAARKFALGKADLAKADREQAIKVSGGAATS